MVRSLDWRYRPSKLKNYVGNYAVSELLKTKLKKGNLPQVLLLYGPHGTGKTTMARILASELQCNNKVTPETKIELESIRYKTEKKIFAIKDILDNKKTREPYLLESYKRRNIDPLDLQIEKLKTELKFIVDPVAKEFKQNTALPRLQKQKELLLSKEDSEKIKEELDNLETELSLLKEEVLAFEDNEEGMACGNCEICREIRTEFIEKGNQLSAVKEYNLASDTGKEFVEARIAEAKQPIPAPYTKKVYIYDEVHRMTKPAQNAFLKFAEEPPKDVYIIFCTTERDKIIDTLQSRMSTHRITKPSLSQLTTHLEFIAKSEGILYEKAALRLIAKASNLIIRDAIKNLEKLSEYDITPTLVQEKLGVTTAEDYFKYFSAAKSGVQALLAYLDKLSQEGRDLYGFYRELSNFLYDIIDIKYRGSQAEVFSPNFKKEIRETFLNYTKQDFLRMVKVFSEFQIKGEVLKSSIKFELLVLGLTLMGQLDPMEEEERTKLIQEDKFQSISNSISKKRIDFNESIEKYRKGDDADIVKDTSIEEVNIEENTILSNIMAQINK